MDLAELWKSGPAIGAAVVSIVGVLYKAAKTLFEYNDEYLRKRPFKRISFLLGEIGDHQELKAFVEATKHAEIFRASFGKPASPGMALAIMSLYKSGEFSLQELQASYLYAKLNPDGSLSIAPGKAGTFIFWFSILFIAIVATYTGLLVLSLLAMKSGVAALLALVVLAAFFFFAWYVGRDARDVLLARAAAKRLASKASEI